MVAGFKRPPHEQTGGLRVSANDSMCGPGSLRARHATHSTQRFVPWISTRRSGEVPAWAWRPSMFWVRTWRSLPARSRSTTAAWAAFGRASRIEGHASSFWSQYSIRAASESRKLS
jgi:hypothetical protein